MRLGTRTSRAQGASLLRLYPRDWRERYGDELLDLVEAQPVDRRLRLDLIRAALDAHLNPWTPPEVGLVASVVAGIAWVAAGTATLVEPVPPDWPGYFVWTLPLGLIGALAVLRLVLTIGRRSGLRGPASAGAVTLFALGGHLLWIASLVVAIAGGPYGALTSAAQSIAAIGTVAVGVVRFRVEDHPLAEAVVVAGAAMLVPTPAAWIVVGVAWLATAWLARPSIDLRPA